MVGARRPVKILPLYQRYTALPGLTTAPGFIEVGLRAYAEADVFVLEQLSDIDTVRNEHLATCLQRRLPGVSKSVQG